MNRPTFAGWLAARLAQAEWKPSEFARRIGKHPPTVSRWLNGEAQPDTTSCDIVADVLNADLDYVLTLAGHRPATAPVDATRERLIGKLNRLRLTRDAVIPLESLLDGLLAAQREARDAAGEPPPMPDRGPADALRKKGRARRDAAD